MKLLHTFEELPYMVVF